MKTTVNDFDTFFESMLTAALWSSTDDNDEPLDRNHSITDIDPDCLQMLKAHALSFWLRCWYYLDHEKPPEYRTSEISAQAGHDFWLTSQGHGSGFLDGDWPIYGELLARLSRCYPEEMQIDFKQNLQV